MDGGGGRIGGIKSVFFFCEIKSSKMFLEP